MASFYRNESEDRRSSGLPEDIRGPMTGSGGKADPAKGAKGTGKVAMGRRNRRLWVSILVDVILLLVLAGLIVGGWLGFRVVRELYAPTWETRTVVYCVEIEGISPDAVKYGPDGRYVFENKGIWSSAYTDADFLGTVTQARTILVAWDDGSNTVTLYVTVEAEAYYREGKGYRMGETMLLAGAEGDFRLEGMTAHGTIVSMHEKNEETAVTESVSDTAA